MSTLTVEVTNRGAVYINDTRVTGRSTKWGIHNIIFSQENVKPENVRQLLVDNGYGSIILDNEYCKEFGF